MHVVSRKIEKKIKENTKLKIDEKYKVGGKGVKRVLSSKRAREHFEREVFSSVIYIYVYHVLVILSNTRVNSKPTQNLWSHHKERKRN